MDKDEILEKSRAGDNDGGRDHENNHSDEKGMLALSFLATILMVYKVYRNLPIGDILSLLFVFLATGMFFRYKNDKQMFSLIVLIGSTIGCIVSLVCYALVTYGS